jgi:AcrR family transcriptional regulator
MSRPSDPTAKIKLLTAAEAVFVRSGLDAAKVEQITERAGLSKGSFYLHFESKEDAFRQLIEAMVARLATYIEDCPVQADPRTQTVDELLDCWVSQDVEMLEFVWQNRGLVGLLLDGGKSAAYRHLVDEFADRASEKTRVVLEHGMKAGLYRGDLDLEVTCAFIGGAYDRMARQIVREPQKPDLRAMLSQVQMLFLRGIASPALATAIAGAGGGSGGGARRSSSANGRAPGHTPHSNGPNGKRNDKAARLPPPAPGRSSERVKNKAANPTRD